jgi:hypothetical protein
MSADSFRIDREQRAVIRFFMFRVMKARVIHSELEPAYGPEALAPLGMKTWRKPFRQGRRDMFDLPRSGRPVTNDLASAIGSMLEKSGSFMQGALLPPPGWRGDRPVDPSRQAWFEKIPSSLGAACPTDQPEIERVLYSKLLLTALMEQKASDFQRIITRDKLWFFYSPRDSL